LAFGFWLHICYNPSVPTARQLSGRIVVTVLLVAIGILVILLPYIVKRQRIPTLLTPATFTDSAFVPAGARPPDSASVIAALATVIDPEVGISIVDMGLVDSLHVDSSGNVNLFIALTTPECPLVGQLGRQMTKAVIAVPGTRRAVVRLDPTLPWDPNRLSPAAKELYRKRFGSR
jgi:metal-sulfur cluster biosynthetic enzyme